MKKLIAIAALAAFTMTTPAYALSDDDEGALSIMTMIMYAQSKCGRYGVAPNLEFVNNIMALKGFSMSAFDKDGRLRNHLRSRVSLAFAVSSGIEKTACNNLKNDTTFKALWK